MKLKLLAATAAAVVCAATGAMAQETGWYGAMDLGYHWPSDLHTTAKTGGSGSWDFSSDNGWAGFARLGYQLNPHWRVEAEGGYRDGDIDTVRARGAAQPVALCRPNAGPVTSPAACGAPDGSLETWTLMGNVVYDLMPDSKINPFVGLGVGVSRVDIKAVGQLSGVAGPVTAANPAFQTLTIDDHDTSLAYQALAGVAWKATDRLNVDLTYRYFGTDHITFSAKNAAAGGFQPTSFSGKGTDQSVTIGLRYSFAAPPPPPPPPPPAFVAKEFIVYFPFDQYILTPEAQAVISEAANYATTGKATSVVVVGHTDTSGSTKYNERLSERRAKAVADALVGAGVAGSALSVDWKGETAPAVATGDGVKEPLNRRSTIGINF